MRATSMLVVVMAGCGHSDTTCGTQGPVSLFENPCSDVPSGVCLLDHEPTGFF
jgi:hypothetical protein